MKYFKNLRKQHEVKSNIRKCKVLITGIDFPFVSLIDYLIKKYSESEVVFLYEHDFLLNDQFFKGPSLLRGEKNLNLLSLLHSSNLETGADLSASTKIGAQFYKDQSFHTFEGRMKPVFPLTVEELYFKEKREQLAEQVELWGQSLENSEEWQQVLARIQIKTEIASIVRPKDVVGEESDSSTQWVVRAKNGVQYHCDELYFGREPSLFYRLTKDHCSLDSKLFNFWGKWKRKACLSVEFTSPVEIYKGRETLFIPQNMTIDNGHFIGEFFPFNETNQNQKFSFFTYLEESEETPDEISKKIRLLTRLLKRVFPVFQANLHHLEKSIVIRDQAPCFFSGDKEFHRLKKEFNQELRGLHFFGMCAPLDVEFLKGLNFENDSQEISHFMRSKISLAQIQDRPSL
jgi:hypothetical protein